MLNLYDLGNVLLRAGRWAEAIEAYRKALAQQVDFVPALTNLGNAYSAAGDERSAESWFRAALARAPRAFDPRLNLANSLVRQGRLAEAEPEYRQAIALAPDDPLVRANYAVLLGGLGRREEARAQLRLAATLPPSAPAAAVAVVTILRAIGPPEAARAAQTQAERRFPDDPGVRRTRAELERGAGGGRRTRFSLRRRCAKVRTDAPRPLYRLGRHAGDPPRGGAGLREARRVPLLHRRRAAGPRLAPPPGARVGAGRARHGARRLPGAAPRGDAKPLPRGQPARGVRRAAREAGGAARPRARRARPPRRPRGRRPQAGAAGPPLAAPLRGARAAARPCLRGRRRARRARRPARGAGGHPRPRGLPAALRRPLSGPAVALLPRGGRADARDGALEAPRGVAALREPRGGRSREPGRAPRPGGGAQLPAAEGGHGPARQRGLRDAARGTRAPLAQGRAQDRAARAARHLPGTAPRPPGGPPDRPSRLDRPPPRGDEALPARRPARARPGAHLEEGAHPPPGHAARRPPRGLRGARRRAHHHHLDRPPSRHELVDVVGGALRRRQEGRDGDGEPDPRPLPARLLRDRRLLHPRRGAPAPRPARGELEHGRPVHQPAGRAPQGRRPPRPPPEQQPAHHHHHRRPADGVLHARAALLRVAAVLRRHLDARRAGDAEGGRARPPPRHRHQHLHARRQPEPPRLRRAHDAHQQGPRALHPPGPARRVPAGRLHGEEAQARVRRARRSGWSRDESAAGFAPSRWPASSAPGTCADRSGSRAPRLSSATS